MDQLQCLAGSKVADTEPIAEIPLDDAYPEAMPLCHPEQPQIESSDSARKFISCRSAKSLWFAKFGTSLHT